MKKCTLTFVIFLSLLTHLFGQEAQKILNYEHISLLDGTVISDLELKDKVVVVNIWATWCQYCIKEIPDMNELAARYENRDDILFLAIAASDSDSSEKVRAFLEQNEFSFQQITPEASSIFLSRVEKVKYPSTLVYDKHSNLVKKFVGLLKEKEFDKLDGIVDELVAE